MAERISRRVVLGGAAAMFFEVGAGNMTLFAKEAQPLPTPIIRPHAPVSVAETTAAEAVSQYKRMRELEQEGKRYIVEEKYRYVSEDLRKQDLRRIGFYKGVIAEVLHTEQIPLAPVVQKALLGITLIESKGNELETGGGLCQISPQAFEEIVKKNPKLSGKNMLNAYNNIWAAATFLEFSTKPKEDPLATVWKFHLGESRFLEGVRLHQQFQPHEKSSIPDLIDSPYMQYHLKTIYEEGSAYKGALLYVPRVMAAATLIEEAMI